MKKENELHQNELIAPFPAQLLLRSQQQARLISDLPRDWRKLRVGGVGGASTCNNSITGAGREIDLAFTVLFLGGEARWEFELQPMDPLHMLGARFRSDHHVVVALPRETWLLRQEEALLPLRSLLAKLSASAASYSHAALGRWGEEGWAETLRKLWAQTVNGYYRGLSISAREAVLEFLQKKLWLRRELVGV